MEQRNRQLLIGLVAIVVVLGVFWAIPMFLGMALAYFAWMVLMFLAHHWLALLVIICVIVFFGHRPSSSLTTPRD